MNTKTLDQMKELDMKPARLKPEADFFYEGPKMEKTTSRGDRKASIVESLFC